MKNFLKFYLVFSLIVVSFSCSEDNDSENQLEENNEYIEYINGSNLSNQLLSEIFIENDNAVTYVYGKTGVDGSALEIESFAYNVVGSAKVDYVVLDDNQRVSFIYTEIGGIKQSEIQVFNYIEENLINFVVYERDWDTMEDTVLDFTVVEIDGDNYNGTGLFRNTNGLEWSTVRNWLGVCVGVAGAAILVYTAPTILAGVLAGVIFAGVASANETPIDTINPEAPEAPEEEVDDNQCEDSDLEVIIGVDPGNELVAIVNGNSVFYDFYWSTGESNTGLISDSIVVTEDGSYYLMVVDDYGCVAFGSATVNENNYEELIIGTWRANSVLFEGSEIIDTSCLEQLDIDSTIINSQDVGDGCDTPESLVTGYYINDNLLYLTDVSGSPLEILELTETNFVLREGEYIYSYEKIEVNIFGEWTIEEFTDCVNSVGEPFTDDAVGTITFNLDYTVTVEDDSGGDYITNYYTFDGNVLTINISYFDYFTPSCDGVDYQTHTYSGQFNYNSDTDSFSGSGNSSENAISGDSCDQYGFNCSSTATFTR